ncbi:MAG: PAC2 family protein, partial [Candidatus Zixiibacteriota bacterium]
MSLHYLHEPELTLPDMICAWPGIGQVAVTVAETLRDCLGSTLFAEIDPAPFFYPLRATVHKGLLEDMEFPTSHFYFSHAENRDLIVFIGEAQPREQDGLYGDGRPAYRLANMVLDVAEKFRCRRIYTSGAAVTQIHHSTPSLVWAVPNDPSLIDELSQQQDVILMSQVTEGNEQGFISGLNGLLVGIARKRGLEAICL